MTQIFGWQADQAGCGHYRIKLPMDSLRETYDLDTGYGLRLGRENPPELLVGQRLGQPRTLALLQWLRRQHGTRVVYEVDDDLLNVPGRNPAAAMFTDPKIRQGMIDCIGFADAVTASTPELATRMAQYTTAPIVVLPNTVPMSVFQMVPEARSAGDGKDADEPVVIGWRGSATHKEDFAEVRHGIGRILESHHTRLKLIGAIPANNLPRDQVDATGWVGIDQFYTELDFDIGIVPLADNVFNQSKSHLAVLEMAARGIPVIASNLPSYRRFITHGENGFLVNQGHEWAKYMRLLVENPGMRKVMGLQAKMRAIQFETSTWAQNYREAYSSVLGVSV